MACQGLSYMNRTTIGQVDRRSVDAPTLGTSRKPGDGRCLALSQWNDAAREAGDITQSKATALSNTVNSPRPVPC